MLFHYTIHLSTKTINNKDLNIFLDFENLQLSFENKNY